MKTKIRKLKIAKETLRHLAERHLGEARGANGVPYTFNCPPTAATCYVTCADSVRVCCS
jgi:hypothetical protein